LEKVNGIKRDVTNLKQQRENDRATHERHIQVLHQNIRRLISNTTRQTNQQHCPAAPEDPVAASEAEAAAAAAAAASTVDPTAGRPADLSATPRTLNELWEEYQNGTGGRKPARLFTTQEKRRVTDKYCRRKVVWDIVAARIRAGDTAQVACDRIYKAYGQTTSVTNIINRIKQDRKHNTLPPDLNV
jgi:hypothetical protein